jgi:2-polyprenyl-3-methyl-5-hydroxy-6-metoxy-1,4-benzoquinol methylase
MLIRTSVADAGNPVLDALSDRLRAYYTGSAEYFEEAEGGKDRFYHLIRPELQRMVAERGAVRVLEFGAGRTGFPRWLSEQGLRANVTFAAQDITPINRALLCAICDETHFSDVGAIDGQFDVIFSTFVYEHLVHPRRMLLHCVRLLRPGGVLLIVSPRYSFPGYIPPALRHLPRWRQLLLNAWLAASAAGSWILRRPNFWIVSQPALFATGFRRDADAIHMVSRTDLDLTLRPHCDAVRVQLPPVRTPRDFALNRLALLVALYRKR